MGCVSIKKGRTQTSPRLLGSPKELYTLLTMTRLLGDPTDPGSFLFVASSSALLTTGIKIKLDIKAVTSGVHPSSIRIGGGNGMLHFRDLRALIHTFFETHTQLSDFNKRLDQAVLTPVTFSGEILRFELTGSKGQIIREFDVPVDSSEFFKSPHATRTGSLSSLLFEKDPHELMHALRLGYLEFTIRLAHESTSRQFLLESAQQEPLVLTRASQIYRNYLTTNRESLREHVWPLLPCHLRSASFLIALIREQSRQEASIQDIEDSIQSNPVLRYTMEREALAVEALRLLSCGKSWSADQFAMDD